MYDSIATDALTVMSAVLWWTSPEVKMRRLRRQIRRFKRRLERRSARQLPAARVVIR